MRCESRYFPVLEPSEGKGGAAAVEKKGPGPCELGRIFKAVGAKVVRTDTTERQTTARAQGRYGVNQRLCADRAETAFGGSALFEGGGACSASPGPQQIRKGIDDMSYIGHVGYVIGP